MQKFIVCMCVYIYILIKQYAAVFCDVIDMSWGLGIWVLGSLMFVSWVELNTQPPE